MVSLQSARLPEREGPLGPLFAQDSLFDEMRPYTSESPSKRQSHLSGQTTMSSTDTHSSLPRTPTTTTVSDNVKTPSQPEMATGVIDDNAMGIPRIVLNQSNAYQVAKHDPRSDGDGSHMSHSKVMSNGESSKYRFSGKDSPKPPRRRKSQERTRTWAEEVERQRRRAERVAEKERLSKKAMRPHSDDLDNATNVIDSFLDHAEAAKRPSAVAMSPRGQSGSRRTTPISSSSGFSDYPLDIDFGDLDLATRRGHSILNPIGVSSTPQVFKARNPSGQPITPTNPYQEQEYARLTTPQKGPQKKTSTGVLSIDDIVRKHQNALDTAMTTATEKVRSEMGLSPGSSRLALPLSPGLPPSPYPSSSHSPAFGENKRSSLDSPRKRQSPVIPTRSSSSPKTNSLPPSLPSPNRSYPSSRSITLPNLSLSRNGQGSSPILSPTEAFFLVNEERSSLQIQRVPLASVSENSGGTPKQAYAARILSSPVGPSIADEVLSSSSGSLKSTSSSGLQKLRGSLKRLDTSRATSPPNGRSSFQSLTSPLSALRETDHASSPSPTPGKSKRKSTSPEKVEAHSIALYLKSRNLNRYVHLARSYPDKPLRVSLAEVGSPTGYPVLVFLGLGCVRYLIALFEDLAKALDLRLICIDRWGYGKTDAVPQDRRGPLHWASIVEKVMDELEIKEFRMIAHSAGAPFAAAVALRMGSRVKGRLHFLAPWVSPEIDGGYKWLKFVPNGLIKSATAADWKLQSFLLGKPPPLIYKPVGHVAEDESTQDRPSLDRSVHDIRLSSDLPPSSSPTPSHASGLIKRASSVFGRSDGLKGDKRSASPKLKTLKSSILLRSNSEDIPMRISSPIRPSPTARTRSETVPSSTHDNNAAVRQSGPHEGDVLEFLTEGFSLPSSPISTPIQSLASDHHDRSQGQKYDLNGIQSITLNEVPEDSPLTSEKPEIGPALTQALMQASHAECEPGTTSDLFSIVLNRPFTPWGFAYQDLNHSVLIQWGKEDDKVSEKSVRWMERSMLRGGCEVRVLDGEGHNLLTSATVMCGVFEIICEDIREERNKQRAAKAQKMRLNLSTKSKKGRI